MSRPGLCKCRLTRTVLLVLAVVTCNGSAVAAEVYKSIGPGGQTVYSDVPPRSGEVERLTVQPPPSAAERERAREQARAASELADRQYRERQRQQADEDAAQQAREQQEKACAAARERLGQLENQPPNRRLVIDPDGRARRLSWQEMEEQREQARRQVDKDCAGLNP